MIGHSVLGVVKMLFARATRSMVPSTPLGSRGQPPANHCELSADGVRPLCGLLSAGTEPDHSSAHARECRFLLGQAFALLVDHLGLRLRKKLLVAELACDLVEFAGY